ncbi:MAG: hypothetical protein OSA11_00640 [Candidatus Nanopelagicales bacterium]|nr:hypothetical protein [Candidatus Nanopelagicales bacterium]
MVTDYEYASGDLLNSPNTYFYSSTAGTDFLDAYLLSRGSVINELDLVSRASQRLTQFHNQFLKECRVSTVSGEYEARNDNFETLLKRFAVTKKIWSEYGPQVRPTQTATFDLLKHYVEFGFVVLEWFEATKDLRYVNALLQVNDILQAHRRDLTQEEFAWTVFLLQVEVSEIMSILK